MPRLLVLEVNEMPSRVLDWWITEHPHSALASLVSRGTVVETVLDEELPRDLYPSQSWASVGTGVPWSEHGVFWYGDPKPEKYPFYWQAAAAAGRRVGLVGVLHSSPIERQCHWPTIEFVMPDVFGDDPTARPAALEPLQKLNLRLSQESARVASLRPSIADAKTAFTFAREGVRPRTWKSLFELAGNVAMGRWNKERLRVGQSMLMADVFERQVEVVDPDLAVLFTNHVASAMHRYWAATFPGDWPEHPYGPEWISTHSGELPYAMGVLDDIVERLLRLADATERALVITTSMGQKPDLTVDASVARQAVIRDARRFLAACGVEGEFEVRGAMVPQLTIASDNPTTLEAAADRLRDSLGTGVSDLMISGDALTLAYDLPCRSDGVVLGRRTVEPASVGIAIEKISDHRSGRHDPRGLLISSRVEGWSPECNALQVAPTLLDLLDVEQLAHHLPAVPVMAQI